VVLRRRRYWCSRLCPFCALAALRDRVRDLLGW
jgi:hypothetical protein